MLQFVNSSTVVKDTGTGSVVTVPVPASVVNGDLMLMSLLCVGSSWVVSSGLSGWSLVQESTGAANAVIRVYSRVASTEPANYAVTLSSTARAVAGIVAYRGQHASSPVHAANNSASSVTGTTFTSPSVTTSIPDGFLLTFVGCRVPSSLTSSWTNATGTDAERMDLTSTTGTTNAGMAVYGSNGGVSTGTHSRNLTCGNPFNQVSAITIALAPAALVTSGFTGWGIPI